MDKVKALFASMFEDKKKAGAALAVAVVAAFASLNLTGKMDSFYDHLRSLNPFTSAEVQEDASPPPSDGSADVPLDEPVVDTPETAVEPPPAPVPDNGKVTCPGEMLTVTDSTGALKACVADVGAAADLK